MCLAQGHDAGGKPTTLNLESSIQPLSHYAPLLIILFTIFISEKSDVQSLSLADILVYEIGADMVLPLGFNPSPAIELIHSEKNEECPKANTCAMVLSLPLAESYDRFKLNIIFGIRKAQGFGFALLLLLKR